MNQSIKRNFALFMVLVICIAFVPALQLKVNANTVENNNVTYRYAGNYVYNWGSREEVATFLSPMAVSFYEEYNTSYDKLSNYSGGTNQANASSSALYDALHDLIKEAHEYETSYGVTRDLYQYTDCQNNGNVISSFYSGVTIGPAWDSGKTWNREHTWPNSKGLEGRDEDDIMMLRPTSVSENSSRGNKAYGKSSGYYNPNKESAGKHDLRGDVARIFLYVYVRWENTGMAWGTAGVMESSEVLLEWMEEDPVDTWELGRNDSVQSITGTRNVFVDYPEFAFLLFGEEIPSDMVTPSGIAKNACDHIYDNACDASCNSCGSVRVADAHVYDNDCDIDCNICDSVRVVDAHVYDNDCDIDCNICDYERKASKHIYDYYCDNTCNRCGEVKNTDHIYIGWKVIEEATTDNPGLERGNCLYCGVETEREIPKLDSPSGEGPNTTPDSDTPTEEKPNDPPQGGECTHIFGEWENNDNDEKVRTCTKCGEVETMPNENGNGDQDTSTSDEPVGFFAKIAQFFKRLFEKIASIFK